MTTWGTAATIWGAVESLSGILPGREFYDSALINSEVSSRIVIRYTSDIKPNYRIVFGSRTFQIKSVIDIDERNKEMNVMVTEEVIK